MTREEAIENLSGYACGVEVAYQTGRQDAIDRVLQIIDEESTKNGLNLKQTAEIRRRVLALKGDSECQDCRHARPQNFKNNTK